MPRHHLRGKAKAEAIEMGHAQGAGAQTRNIGLSSSASCRNMAQRIGALVAEFFCIRRMAAAKGIQNEEKGARHAPDAPAFSASMEKAAANRVRV
jgi:hypothetical protein